MTAGQDDRCGLASTNNNDRRPGWVDYGGVLGRMPLITVSLDCFSPETLFGQQPNIVDHAVLPPDAPVSPDHSLQAEHLRINAPARSRTGVGPRRGGIETAAGLSRLCSPPAFLLLFVPLEFAR